MSKVVKLTQSDIENIVTNIVSEQNTSSNQLPDGEITYDTPEDDISEVETFDPIQEDLEGEGEGKPVDLMLAQGDDGYLYAIDPEKKTVISRIEM